MPATLRQTFSAHSPFAVIREPDFARAAPEIARSRARVGVRMSSFAPGVTAPPASLPLYAQDGIVRDENPAERQYGIPADRPAGKPSARLSRS